MSDRIVIIDESKTPLFESLSNARTDKGKLKTLISDADYVIRIQADGSMVIDSNKSTNPYVFLERPKTEAETSMDKANLHRSVREKAIVASEKASSESAMTKAHRALGQSR